MKLKLKWRVCPKDTSRSGWFCKRGWPTADFHGTDRMAARLECEDAYEPSRVATGGHAPITVYIVKFHTTEEDRKVYGAFSWKKLRKQAATLKEAKEMALAALEANPDFYPVEYVGSK